VPFLLLMYVFAFLGRVNMGFAKQQLQATTGLSDAAFARWARVSSSFPPSCSRCPQISRLLGAGTGVAVGSS
jgi:hypothetical protein